MFAISKVVCVLLLLAVVVVSGEWMTEEAKRVSDSKTPKTAKEYVLDLDLPQEERWKKIGEDYASRSFALVNYLKDNLPDGWLEPLEKVATQLMPFFKDYGDEMKGYAKALNVTEGDIVMINLVYQLEHLGVTCDNWNTTGPVNPKLCIKDNEEYAQLRLYDSEPEDSISSEDGPGACKCLSVCVFVCAYLCVSLTYIH